MSGIPDEQGRRLVIVPDLHEAARTFGTQAAAFRTIMPADGPADVDGASPEFDAALTQVLEAIGRLHVQIAAVIARHGGTLRQAARSTTPPRTPLSAGSTRSVAAVRGGQEATVTTWSAPAESWVGGDIGGLRALAATLSGYLPKIAHVMTALDRQASQLTDGIEGWPPQAASAFTSAWRRDSITADALAAVIARAASIVADLAAELAGIQNALEEEAYTASRYDVRIGTDGHPPPVPDRPPADVAAASERYWALAYQQAFELATAKARQARQQAVLRLMDLYATIEPPRRTLARAVYGTATGA
jgi:Family of unknown function (DUF6317)